MRLNAEQIAAIRAAITSVARDAVAIRVFGSRLNDEARGGDVDLLVDLDSPVEHPALMSARLATRASRTIGNRKVDVVLRAPNFQETTIHKIALEQGDMI